MVEAYGPIWLSIQAEVDALLVIAEADGLTAGQVFKLNRFRLLEAKVAKQIQKYSVLSNRVIGAAQRAAVEFSVQTTMPLVNAALPPGITLEILEEAGIQWVQLNSDALNNLIAVAGDGGPLSDLLVTMGPEVQVGVRNTLTEGLAKGLSPRTIATNLRNRVGMGLTKSLGIARTETLRAYREATRAQYVANPRLVKAYRRLAKRGTRTCMACIALDGTLYETKVPLNEHVNGRCALVPVTVTYRELGLDVDEPEDTSENARDWLKNQTPSTQKKMMGPARFDAWQKGQFELEDMAKIDHNDVWGDQALAKPVKDLVSA